MKDIAGEESIMCDEAAPYETRSLGGPVGDYISGKIALEKKLEICAKRYNVRYTSVRPAILYGPRVVTYDIFADALEKAVAGIMVKRPKH